MPAVSGCCGWLPRDNLNTDTGDVQIRDNDLI